MGDFYEVYGDEAAQASEILDIKLISKVVGGEEIQMHEMIPQHASDSSIRSLESKAMK